MKMSLLSSVAPRALMVRGCDPNDARRAEQGRSVSLKDLVINPTVSIGLVQKAAGLMPAVTRMFERAYR